MQIDKKIFWLMITGVIIAGMEGKDILLTDFNTKPLIENLGVKGFEYFLFSDPENLIINDYHYLNWVNAVWLSILIAHLLFFRYVMKHTDKQLNTEEQNKEL